MSTAGCSSPALSYSPKCDNSTIKGIKSQPFSLNWRRKDFRSSKARTTKTTGKRDSEGLPMKSKDIIDVQCNVARDLMALRDHLINI